MLEINRTQCDRRTDGRRGPHSPKLGGHEFGSFYKNPHKFLQKIWLFRNMRLLSSPWDERMISMKHFKSCAHTWIWCHLLAPVILLMGTDGDSAYVNTKEDIGQKLKKKKIVYFLLQHGVTWFHEITGAPTVCGFPAETQYACHVVRGLHCALSSTCQLVIPCTIPTFWREIWVRTLNFSVGAPVLVITRDKKMATWNVPGKTHSNALFVRFLLSCYLWNNLTTSTKMH